jgi:thiol-disulfide isomerase/thioredoxin
MNKTVIGIIAAFVILGVGAAAFVMSNDSEPNNNETSQADSMEKKDADAMKNDDAESMEKTDETMEKDADDAMMKKAESYVTLAEFDAHKDSYTDQKKVYFFHASWCPICKSIDEDITSDPNQIPSGTTFIKTDFDTSTDLRQKYGVTTQYTFVQVDNDGNEVAQWSATSLDKAIAGIN